MPPRHRRPKVARGRDSGRGGLDRLFRPRAVAVIGASSHAGALAGADVAAGAVLKDRGVQRVASVEELFGVALSLPKCPLPAFPDGVVAVDLRVRVE